MSALKQSAEVLAGASAADDAEMEAKKTVAMAKCQKRLEAARFLYEGGEIGREDYLSRKQAFEDELLHWQNYSSDVTRMHVQLTLCVQALTQLVELWEASNDEGKQVLARGLFDEIVFDLDAEQIVNFKLKPWAQQFLLVRGYMTGAIGSIVPPAGIQPPSVPLAVVTLLRQPFRNPYASERGLWLRRCEIHRLYCEGYSKTDIAREFGISARRVGQVLKGE